MMGWLNTLLGFLQANLIPIFAAVAGYLVIKNAEQWLEGRSAIIIGVMAVVALLVGVTIFQPQIFSFFLDSRRQEAVARAEVITYALDPADDPDSWASVPAQVAARAVRSEYDLKIARNNAAIAAAEAARASHLPPNHPDRVVWDQARMDPAVRSLSPVVQAGASRAGAVESYLSQPLGVPPAKAEHWVRAVYDLPRGLVSLAAILGLTIIAGLSFRVLRLFI